MCYTSIHTVPSAGIPSPLCYSWGSAIHLSRFSLNIIPPRLRWSSGRHWLIFHYWHLLAQRLLPRATGHSNQSEQKRYMTRASTSTCAVSSHHACPNCRKTVSFNLCYFPESLTKSVSAHSSPGNHARPKNLHKCLHSSSEPIHTQEVLLWELHSLSSPHTWRKKVTDHPGLPKEHFPGPKPYHQ